jgi:hypothetical protein
MQPNPINTMLRCSDHCDDVPEEVCDAVFAAVKNVAGGHGDERDARAAYLAPRMAVENWRFCPCFPMLRTQRHEMILSLVHTNLANRLADKAAQTRAA